MTALCDVIKGQWTQLFYLAGRQSINQSTFQKRLCIIREKSSWSLHSMHEGLGKISIGKKPWADRNWRAAICLNQLWQQKYIDLDLEIKIQYNDTRHIDTYEYNFKILYVPPCSTSEPEDCDWCRAHHSFAIVTSALKLKTWGKPNMTSQSKTLASFHKSQE